MPLALHALAELHEHNEREEKDIKGGALDSDNSTPALYGLPLQGVHHDLQGSC